MTEWQTDPQTGLRVGVALIAAILLVDGGLVTWMAVRPVTIWTFVAGLVVLTSFVLIGLMAYWLSGLLHSGYVLDRNAMVIIWGANEQIIPLPDVQQVVRGSEVEGRIRLRGPHWPGHWVGYGEVEGIGPTLFYATAPPQDQILIVTSGLTYGISPENVEGFLQTIQTRMAMGPTHMVELSSKGPDFLQWEFWRDWLGIGLPVAALVLLLALTGFLCARFSTLPRLLPLHFSALGEPDRLGPRGSLFFLPLIGLITLLVNGGLGGILYRRERVAAYLLWAGAAVIQLLLAAAVLGILASL